jgi:polyhydroxyalkanoate synthesis regulator phasin
LRSLANREKGEIMIKYDNSIETEKHKELFDEYCKIRAKYPYMDSETTLVSMEGKDENVVNISKMFKWIERYNEIVNSNLIVGELTKDQWRDFVRDAVNKIKNTFKTLPQDMKIESPKELKSVVDALEKLARLDLTLMGEVSDRIQIDVNKLPEEMTDDELKQLTERVMVGMRNKRDGRKFEMISEEDNTDESEDNEDEKIADK